MSISAGATQCVEIGGIRLLLEQADASVRLGVDATMARFCCDSGRADMRATVRRGQLDDEPAGRSLFRSGGLWELWDRDDQYLFRFSSPAMGPAAYKTARFDRDFRQGEIVIRPDYPPGAEAEDVVHPLEYPLDELVVMHWLAQGRGVELHACGLVEGEEGYLFVGHSGAGKTTVSTLWPGQPDVLSDDRIIVRFEDGCPFMYGTPWHGEARLSAPRRAPIKSIFLLEQADRVSVSPLAPATAVSALMSRAFVPFHSPDALEFTLAFLSQLVGRVSCNELRFRRESDFVEVVRRVQ